MRTKCDVPITGRPTAGASETHCRSGQISSIHCMDIQRVENFTLCPAHYEKWSDDKKARVLREFEATLTKPKEIADHQDLNIFL